eukprot:COSAG01_NODE_616_length_14815_cov_8.518076_17_plen_269_part_00
MRQRHQSAGMMPLLLMMLLAPIAAAPPACDLSGDWLVNTRVGAGRALPASNATTAHVVQRADGSFVATSTDPASTGWSTQAGRVEANRHVTASCQSGCAAPTIHPDCSTAAKCNATCGPNPSGGFHSALCAADGVYYCCQPDSGCNGVHRCPSNKGLADCACTTPPPPPASGSVGTVQPSCSVVLWGCGEPVSRSCEGANPTEVWHKVDHEATNVHVVYLTHFDAGFTHDTSLVREACARVLTAGSMPICIPAFFAAASDVRRIGCRR